MCTTNWAPSNNHSIVTSTHVKLLYQIGAGLAFNLGELIFDEITFFTASPSKTFPSLIYTLLHKQGVYANDIERLSALPGYFTISHPLLREDTRVVDLPLVYPDDQPPPPPMDSIPTASAPAPEEPVVPHVTENVLPNVLTSGAPLPPFASGTTGPMSLQYIQEQVSISDQQIQVMQSMFSGYLQFISLYSGRKGGDK